MKGSSNVKIFFYADVSLAGIAQDGDHILAWPKFLGHLLRGEHVGPGRNSHQETFLLRELLGRLISLVIAHSHHTIENGPVQHFRDEPRADAMNLMGPWFSTGSDRRSGRFNRNHYHVGIPFLKHFPASGNGTTR